MTTWTRASAGSALLAGLLTTAALAGGDKAPHPTAVALQKRCATDPDLRGVLIQPAKSKVEGGRLRLVGLVDNEGQKKAVEKAAADLLKDGLAGVSTDGLAVFPFNSEYRRVLQKHLAEGRHDDKVRDLLRQTRLDHAYFDGESLVLVGACLARTDTLAPIARAVAAAFESEPQLRSHRALMTDRNVIMHDSARVSWADRPVGRLQNEASKNADFDGALFLTNRYDRDGQLRIEGAVPSEAARAWADEFLGRAFKDRTPKWFRPTGERPWSVAGLKVEAPSMPLATLQAQLAEGSDTLRRTRVDRRHFVYPTDREGVLGLRIEALCIDNAAQREALESSLIEQASRAWPALRTTYPGLNVRPDVRIVDQPAGRSLRAVVARDKTLDGVGIADAARFDRQGRLLLRGVRRPAQQTEAVVGHLKEHFFDQEAGRPYRKLGKPAEVGFDISELKTDVVLKHLQQHVADHLEESVVRRLYFDTDGTLALEGLLTSRDFAARSQEVQKKARELIRKHIDPDGRTTVQLLTAPPAKETGPPVKIDELREQPSVTDHLRARLQHPRAPGATPPERHWDGILIRRGFYQPDGQYGLDALLGDAKQKEALGRELDQLRQKEKARWGAVLERGWDRSKLSDSPVESLVRWLNNARQAYRECDGVRVARAYHDVDNRLILEVQVVRSQRVTLKKQLEGAQAKMRELLQQSRWKERIAEGLELRREPIVADVQPVILARGSGGKGDRRPPPDLRPVGRVRPASHEDARRLLLEAINSLTVAFRVDDVVLLRPCPDTVAASHKTATMRHSPPSREYMQQVLTCLDTSLMHNPDDSTTWFVRALCYLVLNDSAQAERDLRRMAELELPPAEDRDELRLRRLRRTERLQGEARQRSAVLEKKVVKDILGNRPPPVPGDTE